MTNEPKSVELDDADSEGPSVPDEPAAHSIDDRMSVAGSRQADDADDEIRRFFDKLGREQTTLPIEAARILDDSLIDLC